MIFDIDIFEILRLTAFSVLFLFHLQPHICYNINPWRRPRQPCQLPNRVNIIRSNKSVAPKDQRLQIHLVHSPIHQLQQDPRLPPTLRQVVRVFLHIIKPILSIQRKVFWCVDVLTMMFWLKRFLSSLKYSEVPNKSVTSLIRFGVFFAPTWQY